MIYFMGIHQNQCNFDGFKVSKVKQCLQQHRLPFPWNGVHGTWVGDHLIGIIFNSYGLWKTWKQFKFMLMTHNCRSIFAEMITAIRRKKDGFFRNFVHFKCYTRLMPVSILNNVYYIRKNMYHTNTGWGDDEKKSIETETVFVWHPLPFSFT